LVEPSGQLPSDFSELQHAKVHPSRIWPDFYGIPTEVGVGLVLEGALCLEVVFGLALAFGLEDSSCLAHHPDETTPPNPRESGADMMGKDD
jgi:hypothetical protein